MQVPCRCPHFLRRTVKHWACNAQRRPFALVKAPNMCSCLLLLSCSGASIESRNLSQLALCQKHQGCQEAGPAFHPSLPRNSVSCASSLPHQHSVLACISIYRLEVLTVQDCPTVTPEGLQTLQGSLRPAANCTGDGNAD